MLRPLLTIATLLTFTVSIAQHWATVLKDRSYNFYEKQAAFEEEWAGKDYVKGKGYKQFKRWEWFWEPRVDAQGNFPASEHLWNEYQDIQREFRAGDAPKANANWQPLGPYDLNFVSYSPGIGRVNIVAEHPNDPEIIFAGTPGGGLWKTTDGGESWLPLTDELPTLGVGGIAIHPTQPDIMYIGTGDGNADDTFSIGVLKSTDGGNSFQETGLQWQIVNNRVSNKVILHPDDPDKVFLCSDAGLWMSPDAGDSWSQIIPGDVKDLEFHPVDASIVYACTERFYKSLDGGESFDIINEGIPSSNNVSRLSIAVSADEPNWVYLLAGDDANQGYLGLWRSTDAGSSFDLRSNNPNIFGWSDNGSDSGGQAWFCMALTVDPDNANRVAVGGVNLWRSNNGGNSWNIEAHWVFPSFTGNYVHADIHSLDYFGGRLYAGTDGGIFISTDDGNNFTDITPGMANTQFYRLGGSASDADIMLAGAQDNGVFLKDGSNWGQAIGADGMECVIHPTDPDIMYASTQNGNLRRSTNGGNSFQGWTNGIDQSGAWVTPFMLDPENPNILWAGYESLWRRAGGGGWQQIGPEGSNITAFNIAPSDNDYIYVARGGSMSRTTDGGVNWETVSGLPGSRKTSIAINPQDPAEVYVTLSNYSEGQKVYHSTDAGETWENMSLNLPNLPANTIVFEPSDANGLYVGMDVGVFYINDNLTNWVAYDIGLPNVVVSELEIHVLSGKIRAATYGRGIWESDLFTSISQQPIAQFTADDRVVCVGEEVDFQDLSLFASPGWAWSFEGGSPSSSDQQNPTIVYNEPGIYNVSLDVQNDNGTSSTTEEFYIKVIPIVGDELPVQEGFETIDLSSSLEWFVENQDDDMTWAINEDVGNGSQKSIWIDNYNNQPDREDELLSTTYDLSDASEVMFTFDVAYAQRSDGDADRLRVFVSQNCGSSYSLKRTLLGTSSLPSAEMTDEPFFPADESEWQTISIDNLTQANLDEDFRIRFEFESDGGNNVFIDNINLSIVPVSTLDIDKVVQDLIIYPNPAVTESTMEFGLLRSSTCSYRLLDMTGRVVIQESFGMLSEGPQLFRLPLENLSQGIYSLEFNVDELRTTRLLSVE